MGNGARIPALVLSGAYYLYLYDSSLEQVGSIATSGQGVVAFDRQGDIYYTPSQQYNCHVLIFSPPYTGKPKEVLFCNVGYAVGVTVDWKTGVFAVGTDAPVPYPNYYSDVWFFRHGQATPCADVQWPSSWSWDPTGSFDSSGTLFASGTYGASSTIVSISGECSAKSSVSYAPSLSLLRFQFNTKDQLVVHETTGFQQGPLVTYPHPKNGNLGTPVSKAKLDDINGKSPNFLTFTGDGQHLWASAACGDTGEYQYPQGGKPYNLISAQCAAAGAVCPPAVP